MSAVNSPQQFKLFMTGTEWQDSITHSTDGPIDTVWQEKATQAATFGTHHGAGLKVDIAKRGYVHDDQNPPSIVLEDAPNGKSVRTVQSDGHHRIAAMADLESQSAGTDNPRTYYIPTRYSDNTSAGRRARGQNVGVRRIHGANALQRSGEADGK